ncbi:protein phosphatase [Nakamurella sp. UYEF19]|uniref:PP2C family protein-serine/threonine phosphatase n=1 Tax=Nakamurella sp. UYEF19 TaxID=1756392 RepID=UPI003391086D
MTHVLRYAARTDRGLLRANNQDSVFAGDRLLVIADGMGGHAAGDVASRLVVAAFVDLDELALGSDMVRPLTDATREGNSAIAEMVDENPELDGMGTTLTALLFDGPVVALAHVGDSRAYLYRNGVLHQISHDDTFVQSLVDDGRITADEAAHHPQRSLLLRALNGTAMDPSITMRETSPGDRFLICSDGLSDVVSPESIADALGGPDPDQVADTLIQLALVGGGPDNVTVIVADVVETGGATTGLPAGGIDPEATGPMQAIHLTQKMPRVPLPPIPEDVPAKPEYASIEEGPQPHDDEFQDDDEFDDDDEFEEQDAAGYRSNSDDDAGVAFAPDGKPATATGDRTMLVAPPRRRWHRRWAFGLALVVLVGVGLTGSYLWASTKYYVGDNEDQVAVFKGVNGSLLGWKFASVQENSCAAAATPCTPLKITDLVQSARDQVAAGIPVGTLTDARAVMTRLTSELLPPCPTNAGGVTGTASSGAASSSATSSGAGSSGGVSSGPAPSSGGALPSSAPSFPSPTSLPPTAAPPTTSSRVTTLAKTTPARTTAGRTTPARTTVKVTPKIPPARTTPARTTAKTTPARTTPARTTPARTTPATTAPRTTAPRTLTTITLTPPTPVTTTVTVTVDQSPTSGSGTADSGQRLRAGNLLTLVARAAATGTPAASGTAASKPAVSGPVVSGAVTIGPVTRAGAPGATPTVTVFTTVTNTAPASSGSSSTGAPLVSPVAQPGITCRLVS